jgi:hypothetical protein
MNNMERVVAYIDGFNLYFGLKQKGWKRYYWPNIQAMVQRLLSNDQKLLRTKYFTSRVKYPNAKSQFPQRVQEAGGFILQKPVEWR